MKENLSLAVEKIRKSPFTLAFTGAGISVESGIPPFRGEKGIWNKYDSEVLEINYFYNHGEKSWDVIREIFYDNFGLASPNPAHFALAKMEELGFLHAIVTQNIDNLHQMAGSKNIAEFHGNSSRLICPECNTIYPAAETDLTKLPPRCQLDHHILKPDFVFFGEGIPADAWERSFDYAAQCSVCLIIGSTGEVVPASYVPQKASQNGAYIIEINPEESQFTHSITNLHLKGMAGEILPRLLEELEKN